MDRQQLLIDRTRAAAELYFSADNPAPPLETAEECAAACQAMNIDPRELVNPDSRAWLTIQLCRQMRDGSAVFNFRGSASEDIITDAVKSATDV